MAMCVQRERNKQCIGAMFAQELHRHTGSKTSTNALLAIWLAWVLIAKKLTENIYTSVAKRWHWPEGAVCRLWSSLRSKSFPTACYHRPQQPRPRCRPPSLLAAQQKVSPQSSNRFISHGRTIAGAQALIVCLLHGAYQVQVQCNATIRTRDVTRLV